MSASSSIAMDRQQPKSSSDLVVTGVTCTFGGTVAVRQASFSVAHGSITAIVGPNGAGKSTVLKAISGAIRPNDGRIEFREEDITNWPAYRIAQAGVIRTFQLAGVFGHLTVLENVLVAFPHQPGGTLWGSLRGKRYWSRTEHEQVSVATALLDRFGLGDKINDYAGELSGGQMRLLELARCLTSKPKLLLLDEPTNGVSPPTVELMVSYLAEAQRDGLTMILVEHQFAIVEALADRVVVMAEGQVIATDTPANIAASADVQQAYVIG